MKELSDVDIRHFKLSSGDEIISLVTKDDSNVVVLSQPMQMHSAMSQQTQAYYFTDWQPMAKHNVCAISKLHIISFVECDDRVKAKYISMCLDTSDPNPTIATIAKNTDIDPFDELDLDNLDDYSLEDLPDDTPTYH